MKILRMDPEQAAMLASWLRIVATHFDKEAARIGNYPTMRRSADAARDQAARARKLADRLSG